jgi:hypothetical protein
LHWLAVFLKILILVIVHDCQACLVSDRVVKKLGQEIIGVVVFVCLVLFILDYCV